MRIAVISDSTSRGGAAIAAARVMRAIQAQRPDAQVRWFVANEEDGGESVVSFVEPGRVRGIVRDVARRLGGNVARREAQFSARRNRENLLRRIGEFSPDVISLHSINQWTKAWLPPAVIGELCAIAPCAWTLHDFWPLAGVDYPASPEKLATPAHLASCGDRLALIAPSRWIGDIARRLLPAAARIEVIPHGVDLAFFHPLDRAAARGALDLPAEGPLALFAAGNLADPRKGLALLVAALKRMRSPPAVALMGNQPIPIEGLTVIRLGSVADERLLRLAYSAVDLVAVPSAAEVFGLVAIEAMSCGRPAVGFRTGGLAEIIRPGVTGELANPGDADDLAARIETVMAKRSDLPKACREVAERDYDVTRQATAYMTVFESLVRR